MVFLKVQEQRGRMVALPLLQLAGMVLRLLRLVWIRRMVLQLPGLWLNRRFP